MHTQSDLGSVAPAKVDEVPVFLDTSQSASRGAFSENYIRAMCASSSYYSFAEDRAIKPYEHLLLLGWSKSLVRRAGMELSSSQLRDLAGESMGCPCIGLIAASLSLSLPGVWAR